jgi:hypothetical protein
MGLGEHLRSLHCFSSRSVASILVWTGHFLAPVIFCRLPSLGCSTSCSIGIEDLDNERFKAFAQPLAHFDRGRTLNGFGF